MENSSQSPDQIEAAIISILEAAEKNDSEILWEHSDRLTMAGQQHLSSTEDGQLLFSTAAGRMLDRGFLAHVTNLLYRVTATGQAHLDAHRSNAQKTETIAGSDTGSDSFSRHLREAMYSDRGQTAASSALQMSDQAFLNQLMSGLEGSARVQAGLALLSAEQTNQSINRLTPTLIAFVDEVRRYSAESTQQATNMLRESKWLGRWTLALAVATVIMSWATWDMSSVSRSQLNLETSDEKQEIERTKKEAERIKGELVWKPGDVL